MHFLYMESGYITSSKFIGCFADMIKYSSSKRHDIVYIELV